MCVALYSMGQIWTSVAVLLPSSGCCWGNSNNIDAEDAPALQSHALTKAILKQLIHLWPSVERTEDI